MCEHCSTEFSWCWRRKQKRRVSVCACKTRKRNKKHWIFRSENYRKKKFLIGKENLFHVYTREREWERESSSFLLQYYIFVNFPIKISARPIDSVFIFSLRVRCCHFHCCIRSEKGEQTQRNKQINNDFAYCDFGFVQRRESSERWCMVHDIFVKKKKKNPTNWKDKRISGGAAAATPWYKIHTQIHDFSVRRFGLKNATNKN